MDTDKSTKNIIANTFWTIKQIIKLNPVLIGGIIFFQIAGATAPFFRNRIFSQLIDSLVYSENNWSDHFLVFLVILLFTSVVNFFQYQLDSIMGSKLMTQLQVIFSQKLIQLDYQHLESKETSNLIAKTDNEFEWRFLHTFRSVNSSFINIISLITVTIIILPKYPFLWLVLFLSQIPQYYINKYWAQKDWQLHESNSEKNTLYWDLSYQLRQKDYVAELRMNQASNMMFQKIKDTITHITNGKIGLKIAETPSELGLTLFSILIGGYTLYVLITDTQSGLLTIGLFTFYFQTIQQTSDFFRGLVSSLVDVTENSYHIGNFRKIIGLKNTITSGTITFPTDKPVSIEFKDVSFKYPNSKKFVFKNLNLYIKSGEEIAIVGHNGAGKSTLIKLLCRFYDPTSGQILINGVDLKDIDLNCWNRQLSYLSQEFNHYWNLNLRENITIGKPELIDDKRVYASLKKADAKFALKYPNKLDTMLSNRYGGDEPSWGQWQKIAIARIFYRNSPIVVLDEPTASIDAVSESKIFSHLYREFVEKTVIIVSHRFSTVRNAEKIIVIDKGKIIEQGSHQELLALKGAYAHSFNLQAKGYQENK